MRRRPVRSDVFQRDPPPPPSVRSLFLHLLIPVLIRFFSRRVFIFSSAVHISSVTETTGRLVYSSYLFILARLIPFQYAMQLSNFLPVAVLACKLTIPNAENHRQ